MKINKETQTKNTKLKNYTEFVETITNNQEVKKQKQIQANADYIEYIKEHDKEAYKNYLSYSTYLELDGI